MVDLTGCIGQGCFEILGCQIREIGQDLLAALPGGIELKDVQAAAAMGGWLRGFSILDEPGWSLVTTDSSHQWNSLREALLKPSRWAGLLI